MITPASGAIGDALEALVLLIEQQRPGMRASILVISEDGAHLRHGAAPSLPPAYSQAIDGIAIGPAVGSCGTAAWRRERVVVRDIATDPLWAEFRELAARHGLAACWSNPVFAADGRLLGTFALYHDRPCTPSPEDWTLIESATMLAARMLERYLLESELLESEARFRAFQDASPDGFILCHTVMDPAGAVVDFECVYANPAAERIDGGRGIVGRRLRQHWPVIDSTGLFREYERVARTGSTFECERAFARGEREVWLRLTAVPTTSGIAVCYSDVTDRKLAEREREEVLRDLANERARLTELVMQTPAFIAVLRGPEHVFELTNPPYDQLIGHRPVIGRTIAEALPELQGQGFSELLREVYDTGRAFTGTEVPILLRYDPESEPEERVLNFVYQPFREADGRVTGIIAHGVDVTEQVLARRRVEKANSAKADFLATMSHELRTPLNAMIGYSDLLQAGIPEPLPPAALASVERIRLSARHLLELIEEILTFSRLDAGRESLDLETTPLHQILEEVSAIAEPLAFARSLGFRIRAPEPPPTIRTDPRKLRQILLNLVGNAIKFTNEGEVTVEVRLADEHVQFDVADTGVGITPDDLEHVFEPFWQAEARPAHRASGTGLGLSVSRRLAHLLGGDITVESTPGSGTTFHARLPVDPARAISPEAEATEAALGAASVPA